jgi:DNA-binding transcriptional ArsR family regulator
MLVKQHRFDYHRNMIEKSFANSLPATLAVPSKTAILSALMSGLSLPAGELAYRAAVSYPTTSFHLKQLLNDGYVKVRRMGRHRYYELADAHVAEALEKLSLLTPALRERRPPKSQTEEIRRARMCYDHVAGRLGVALLQSLRAHGYLHARAGSSEELDISDLGKAFFSRFGIDVDALYTGRRKIAFECTDWSERTAHLGGALGCGLGAELQERGWIKRHSTDRALIVTPAGRRTMPKVFGINVRLLLDQPKVRTP